MTDHPTPEKLGLTDAELAVHPTMFASDALKGLSTRMVSCDAIGDLLAPVQRGR